MVIVLLRRIALFLILLLPFTALAQQGNYWMFAEGLGLNFNENPPEHVSSELSDLQQRSAAISSCSGELIFYASNCTIWNADHEIVHFFDDNHLSDHCIEHRGSGVLIPDSGDSNQYYWFYMTSEGAKENTLYYTLMDKSLNNGKGGTVPGETHVHLKETASRLLLPVLHDNEKDFWLMSPDSRSLMNVFPITENGVGQPVQSTAYILHPYFSDFSVSPSREKLVTTRSRYSRHVIPGLADQIDVMVYDFNASTGEISNPTTVLTTYNFPYYPGTQLPRTWSAAFSPDNNVLYVGDGVHPMGLYQIDLQTNQVQNIVENYQINYNCANSMHLAPDGRILLFCWGKEYMHAINNPNELGDAANFEEKAIEFGEGARVSRNMSNVYTPPVQAGFEINDNCADTTTFTNTSDTSDVDSVRWYFGDGDSADTWHAQHAYADEGAYYVQMKAWTGGQCAGHVWRSDSVEIKHPARAGFKTDTFSFQCNQATLHLKDTSHNTETISYDFGNETFTTANSHTYDSSGTYYIRQATESSRGCTDTTGDSTEVYIAPPPEADFSITDNNGCVPFTPGIENNSNGTTNYRWLVDNTEADSGRIPEFAIESPGTYDLTLIAYNEQHCPDTLHIPDALTTHARPEPSISYSNDTLCLRQDYSFEAEYDNANDFTWHFHDGSTATGDNTEYTFTDSGLHQLIFEAANDYCTDTADTSIHLRIESFPEAQFSVSDTGSCAPLETRFSALKHPWHYQWNITGPENKSAGEQNPAFSLSDSGRYDVQLVTYNNQGCRDTMKKDQYLEVVPPAVAGLDVQDSIGCEHVRFQFTDLSQFADSWHWNFGDGNTSGRQNPVHVYTEEGLYDITQVASNKYCSDTAYTEEPVEIIPAPEPDFSISDQKGCTPASFELNSHAQGDIVDEYFTTARGDTIPGRNGSFTVDEEDTFFVYQHLESSTGCQPTDSAEVIVLQQPTAGFEVTDTVKNCGQETWHFTDTSQFNKEQNWWIDGEAISNNPVADHTFSDSDPYHLQLEARRHFCADTLESTLDVDIRHEPEVDFYAPDTVACLPGDVQFVNETEHADRFSWNFGKGNPQIVTNTDPVENRYEESGLYTITLEAESNEGCIDTLVRTYYINIVDSVRAAFDLTPEAGCQPLNVQFTNHSETADLDLHYKWHFDTGDSSTDEHPHYTYDNISTGTYEVVLEASNQVCSDQARALVDVTGFDGEDDQPEMHAATVDNDNVRITWDEEPVAVEYHILRDRGAGYRVFDQTTDTTWLDEHINVDSSVYQYRIEAVDSCGNTSARSRLSQNIRLTGEQENNEIALISWNSYRNWPSGVSAYHIDRREINGQPTLLDITNNTEFTDQEYFKEYGSGYCYQILATEVDGSAESLSNEICLPYEAVLFVPNAFSPNQSGLNDYFEARGAGIQSFELRIYNRWGQQLYHSTDMEESWDGTYQDSEVDEGIYLYTIQASGVNGEELNQHGTLHLFR